jgi:hypothetical protein
LQFLCDLTDLGRSYTVLDCAPGMKGVRITDYTLGQLFDRLADHSQGLPCQDRARLLAEAKELLGPVLPSGLELMESTVLGQALAAP